MTGDKKKGEIDSSLTGISQVQEGEKKEASRYQEM